MTEIRTSLDRDHDRPLREDIRLLGRILGDIVREQEGETVFEIVERIRQTSVRFHRDQDTSARQELEAILNALTDDQTSKIIRAFSYFSHLANIAEDQHHIRRTRAHLLAGSVPHRGTLADVFRRCKDAGIDAARLRDFFSEALVSPVLTAHPTEVRRKSTLDREIEVTASKRRPRSSRLTSSVCAGGAEPRASEMDDIARPSRASIAPSPMPFRPPGLASNDGGLHTARLGQESPASREN